MECQICIEPMTPEQSVICKNNDCAFECCITCMKRYLLTSIQEPHCMMCKHAMNTTDFITYFPKSWRLNKYKEHKKTILWAKEQSKMTETLDVIAHRKKIEKYIAINKENRVVRVRLFQCQTNNYLNNTKMKRLQQTIQLNGENDIEKTKKAKEELKELKEKNKEIEKEIVELRELIIPNPYPGAQNEEQKQKSNYKFKCPKESCNGLLDSQYSCVICTKNYCKDCFECIEDEDHECDEETKKNIQQIKKDSRPCPSCGEMIYKVSGCAQIFCTRCGTAFCWNTGHIEKGIIHNPHAAAYFANNPDAKENYLKRVNNRGNDDNECGYVNLQRQLTYLIEDFGELEETLKDNLAQLCTNIYNFNNYRRRPSNEPDNLDYRIKWLLSDKNEQNEKNVKMVLHSRAKKNEKNKMDDEILSTTCTLYSELLLNITLCVRIEDIENMWHKEFMSLYDYTNNELKNTGEYFDLKPVQISTTFDIIF